jgi:hypothetical protein
MSDKLSHLLYAVTYGYKCVLEDLTTDSDWEVEKRWSSVGKGFRCHDDPGFGAGRAN